MTEKRKRNGHWARLLPARCEICITIHNTVDVPFYGFFLLRWQICCGYWTGRQHAHTELCACTLFRSAITRRYELIPKCVKSPLFRSTWIVLSVMVLCRTTTYNHSILIKIKLKDKYSLCLLTTHIIKPNKSYVVYPVTQCIFLFLL